MAGEQRYPSKVVVLTGGTRGIGEACVREFVSQGAKVVFCAPESEREREEALQSELEASGHPGEAHFVVCDVSSETDIKNLVSETINQYGCIDCLVNNAATSGPLQEIDDVTAEDFQRVMKVNALGYFLTAKYSLPHLRETKGNIINISSIAAFNGSKNLVAYATSKGAVTAMTKAMALDESKYGVRVNSISPGNIWTSGWQKYASLAADSKKMIQEVINAQPLGRLGTPAEIAKAALFLAADATFFTGFDLWFTGGVELGSAQRRQQDDAKGIKG